MSQIWRLVPSLSLALAAVAASGCASESTDLAGVDDVTEDIPVGEAQSPLTGALIGAVEAVDPQGIVRGWAKDPANPTYPVYIRILSDGVFVSNCSAVLEHAVGRHGFACHLPASVGNGQPHQLQVQALNSGPAPTILYDQPVTLVYQAPFGIVESFDRSTGKMQGWALDLDTPAQQVTVTALVPFGFLGMAPVATTKTTVFRKDVNAAYGIRGRHGFVLQIPAKYKGEVITVQVADSSGNVTLTTKLANSDQVF